LYADVLVSCLALGPLIGRWSCFLNGCCFGKVISAPWAIVYPHGSYVFAAQVRQGLVDPLAAWSLPVHPLPVYLSLNGLVLFVLFSWLWKRAPRPAGILFGLYWATYAGTRFFLEYFRDSGVVASIGGFTLPQVMAMGVFALALIGTAVLLWTHRYHNAGMSHTRRGFIVSDGQSLKRCLRQRS